MIEELLKNINFNNKEIQVYLCILEHGKISNAAVSKITKINRTTVYSVSKELIKKGVITEEIGGAHGYYTALPIEELRELYKKEEELLVKKRDQIESLIKELQVIPKSKNYSVPKIKFIEEYQLNDFLYRRLPFWIESAKNKDFNWWGFQDPSVLEQYKEWNNYFWDIIPENMGIRVFTNKKQPENSMAEKAGDLKERRQVKYLDGGREFSASYQVIGDYVIFLASSQHPHYLVEIHDVVMAENLRGIFREMWDRI